MDKGVDDSNASPSGSTGYGSAWGDFNNDNMMDIFVAKSSYKNY